MPSKRIIAVLAVLLGAVVAAPASASAAEVCPPGVTDATYCAAGNVSGVAVAKRTVTTSNDRAIDLTVPCKTSTPCVGKLFLEGPGGKILGTVSYSIKPGGTAKLHIRLTAAGRKLLEKNGKLNVKVAAVSKGVRSGLGTMKVVGKKKH
jgi:hypothetical protein